MKIDIAMNRFQRPVSSIVASAVLGCALGGCASTSGSYVVEPGRGARRIDPAAIATSTEAYRLAPRDVLVVQILPVDQGSTPPRIDRGNHLRVGLELAPMTKGDYRVMAGDDLALDFGDDSERTYEVHVAPDGRAILPRIGRSVRAEGQTIAELDRLAQREYQGLYLVPRPSWSVRRSAADTLVSRTGDYPVGTDGAIVIPGAGRVVVLSQTPDEAAASIAKAMTARFRNPVAASVSLASVNTREQIDPRLLPNGLEMFTNATNLPQPVSDLGTIYVPTVGEVDVGGRTVREVHDRISEIAGRRYQNPISVSVSVLSYGNESVYIGGEVKAPGRYPFTTRLSLLKVIALAGWGNEFADMENILLLRPSGPHAYTVYRTNLQEVMDGAGPGAQDLQVSAQDLVIVPPTGVAKANRFVSQYLKGMLPFGTAVSYTINRGALTN